MTPATGYLRMEPLMGSVLHETKDYAIEVRIGTYEGMIFKGLPCYAIVNKRTGVVEAEGRIEGETLRAMHEFQAGLTEALADPTGYLAVVHHPAGRH